ncbi:MAG: dipeptidase PepE [Planctomycetota bacterium]
MRRLLLISNSTMHGRSYLEHVREALKDHLNGCRSILFVPWALKDHDAYADKAAAAFAELGIRLQSIHREDNVLAAIGAADAVFVGGGNTFRLLDRLHATGAAAAIAARAEKGMPYVGSSAGTNVATLSIRTTNDMPIVEPKTFAALGLVPFQINPHYLDADPKSTHMGETREERLRQFHEEHDTPVLGLREGGWLDVRGAAMRLCGTMKARLFCRGEAPLEIEPGSDLSFLLKPAVTAGNPTR